MRVVLYLRGASTSQYPEALINRQKEHLEKYALEKGYEIVGIMKYYGSGKRADEFFREAADNAEKWQADLIVAENVNRFTC